MKRSLELLKSNTLAGLLISAADIDDEVWNIVGCPFYNHEDSEWSLLLRRSTPPKTSVKFIGKPGLFAPAPPEYSGQEQAILDSAKRSGLLASFEEALKASSLAGTPSNIEKYFLKSWLSLARPRTVPSWALSQFRELYPGKTIQFFGGNAVGAVVANGEIVLFVPINLVAPSKTPIGQVMADPSGVRQWIKTRMGYVPQDARVALDAMRVRSYGELAIPDIGGVR